MSNIVKLDFGLRDVANTLRLVADKIDSGELKGDVVYVAMAENVAGGTDYVWSMSSMTKLEILGLLARHLHLQNDR